MIARFSVDSDAGVEVTGLSSDLLSVKAVGRDRLRHGTVGITLLRALDTVQIEIFVGRLTVAFELGSVALRKVLDTPRGCGLGLRREDSVSQSFGIQPNV